jgi:hypothetical protein
MVDVPDSCRHYDFFYTIWLPDTWNTYAVVTNSVYQHGTSRDMVC